MVFRIIVPIYFCWMHHRRVVRTFVHCISTSHNNPNNTSILEVASQYSNFTKKLLAHMHSSPRLVGKLLKYMYYYKHEV